MKAVVLEIRDGYSAVLREDGIVEKCYGTYEIGDTVDIPVRKEAPQWRRSLRAAIAAIVLVGILGSTWSYQNVLAYSYVSVDVGDTSLEYTLNRQDKIIGVTAENDSSEAVAEELSGLLKNTDFEEALSVTMDYMEENGEPESNVAYIALSSDSEKRAVRLMESFDGFISGSEHKFDFHSDILSKDDRRNAQKQEMSIGRWKMKQNGKDGLDYKNGNIDDLMFPNASATANSYDNSSNSKGNQTNDSITGTASESRQQNQVPKQSENTQSVQQTNEAVSGSSAKTSAQQGTGQDNSVKQQVPNVTNSPSKSNTGNAGGSSQVPSESMVEQAENHSKDSAAGSEGGLPSAPAVTGSDPSSTQQNSNDVSSDSASQSKNQQLIDQGTETNESIPKQNFEHNTDLQADVNINSGAVLP